MLPGIKDTIREQKDEFLKLYSVPTSRAEHADDRSSIAYGTCQSCHGHLPSLLRSNRTGNQNCYGYWESLLRVLGIDDRRNTAQLFEADMKVSFDEKMTEIRAHREAWTKSRKQTQARRARARPSVCD